MTSKDVLNVPEGEKKVLYIYNRIRPYLSNSHVTLSAKIALLVA